MQEITGTLNLSFAQLLNSGTLCRRPSLPPSLLHTQYNWGVSNEIRYDFGLPTLILIPQMRPAIGLLVLAINSLNEVKKKYIVR